MKWTYKECEVEVTAVYESQGKKRLTPTVEIRCKDTGEPHLLTTKKSFATEMQAELFGAQIAREWIDEECAVTRGAPASVRDQVSDI